MAFSDTLSRAIQFEVMGIPFGRGGYFAAGRGATQALLGLLQQFGLPPFIGAVGGAWAANNVAYVQQFLGRAGAHDLSSVMVMEGVNSQFDVTGRIESFLSQVDKYLPGGTTSGVSSVPATSRVPVPAPRVGEVPARAPAEGVEVYDDYLETYKE